MGIKRDIRYDDAPGKPLGWLTTFNDLITLLMVFFVLLFSMGSMDVKRFKNFQNALQSAMGVMDEGRHAPEGLISDQQGYVVDPTEQRTANEKQTEDFRSLARTRGLEAVYTSRGLQLTLNDELLFPAGSARITEPGIGLLKTISAVIRPLKRRIRIEGHTDNRPIATERYPSNWELSAARAISVLKFFINHGGIPAASLSAAGYGSSKPREPNDTDAHRGMNRRVEIILGQVEPSGIETRPIGGE